MEIGNYKSITIVQGNDIELHTRKEPVDVIRTLKDALECVQNLNLKRGVVLKHVVGVDIIVDPNDTIRSLYCNWQDLYYKETGIEL